MLSPSSRIGRAHASLGYEAHPCPLGEGESIPQRWPYSLLFRHQNCGWKHPSGEANHPTRRPGSSSEPKIFAQKQHPSFPCPFFVGLGTPLPLWWA